MPTVLDRTKRPAPGWRRNSDRQVTKKHARWKAAGKHGRKPAFPSHPERAPEFLVSEMLEALRCKLPDSILFTNAHATRRVSNFADA